MQLPEFRYHPDPLATGSAIATEMHCVGCEQRRPYAYDGPVYGNDDLDEADAICPWCIADGTAERRFDATFH